MICADTENDPRVNATAAAALGVRSILMVPMVRGREVVGMIEVLAAGPNRFGASHVTALERVSRVLLRLFTGITEAVAEQVEKHSSIASDAVDRRIDGELEAPPPSMVPETAAAESRAATLQETPAAGPMRGGLLGIGETATIEPDRSGRRVAIIVGVLLLLLLLFIAWWSVARAGEAPPGRSSETSSSSVPDDAEALFARARQLQSAEGTPGDCLAALEMMRRAAEAGHLLAQYELGDRYKRAECGAADAAGSAQWFGRAAERGHPQAQREYASALAEGRGISRDRVSAYAWYVLAQKGGDQASEAEIRQLTRQMSDAEILRVRTRLGSMYAQGTGTARNYVRAYMWFTLAEEGGDASARNLREDIGKTMKPEQIEQARNMAEEWLRRHRTGMPAEEAEPTAAGPERGGRRAESTPRP
jgi:hypothetical protein